MKRVTPLEKIVIFWNVDVLPPLLYSVIHSREWLSQWSIDHNILPWMGAAVLEENAATREKFPVGGVATGCLQSIFSYLTLSPLTISGVPLLFLCFSDENNMLWMLIAPTYKNA